MGAELYNPSMRTPPPPLYSGFRGRQMACPGEGEYESGIGTCRALVKIVDMLKKKGVPESAIRIGQRQVHGVAGTVVPGQTNKPDISFPYKKKRYNIELDTNAKQSLRHQNVIANQNQTKDRTWFLGIDPASGKIKTGRVWTGKKMIDLKRPGPPRLREFEYEYALSEW